MSLFKTSVAVCNGDLAGHASGGGDAHQESCAHVGEAGAGARTGGAPEWHSAGEVHGRVHPRPVLEWRGRGVQGAEGSNHTSCHGVCCQKPVADEAQTTTAGALCPQGRAKV